MRAPPIELYVGIVLAAVILWWCLSSRQKSIAISLAALVVALLAAGGGYYAFFETRSLPWTFAYVLLAAFSLAVAGLRFFDRA